MSIWDEEWEDYELDKHDFEVWLDSLEGEGTDKEKYDKWIDEQFGGMPWTAEQKEQVRNSKCPEWIIETPKFIYRICLN